MHTFDKVPWVDYLTQMQTRGENEIHFSPSLEIENKATRSGLTISVFGEPEKYEFYVFYKRPKKVARFFGLTSRMNNNYLTDAAGLTHQDARDCLQALLDGNDAWLDQIIKS